VVLGEISNFAAYSFAPAILVTPLGAGSVLLSAVLASVFLKERLGVQGVIGCALCLIGSLVIILHAPGEKEVNSVDEILQYAMGPAFFLYMLAVSGTSIYLIYWAGPKYGKENMLVYITICSLVGSISVMACKGFGIAIRLTFEGRNQFTHISTYVLLFIVISCAITQMNYFNKALGLFSTNRVTPGMRSLFSYTLVYYVFFTTATIIASVLLFQVCGVYLSYNIKGFNDESGVEIATVLCGFIIIFIGVFQLNDKSGEHGHREVDEFMELESFSNSETLSESGIYICAVLLTLLEHRYSASSRRSSIGKKKMVDIAYFQSNDEDYEEFA
jgi:drug/metabolite transporter (DMT)-like permease